MPAHRTFRVDAAARQHEVHLLTVVTSIPVLNLTAWTTFGNWFSPFSRRHVFAAALTSLNTMSLAVCADRASLVRTVRVWQFMRDNWLSNWIFKSYDDLVDHCCEPSLVLLCDVPGVERVNSRPPNT